MRQGYPPETRQTLERLLAAGETRRAATEKIAAMLLHELRDMLARQVMFDHARFARRSASSAGGQVPVPMSR
ncbi:MAG TPA: hypothetical protein VIG30_07385 [Ktedonobacterales bacterium]